MKKDEIIVLFQDLYNKIPDSMRDQIEEGIPVMRDHLPILHDYLVIKEAIAFSEFIMDQQAAKIKKLTQVSRSLAERCGASPPSYEEETTPT
jgi:hypothetical protein